MKPLLLDLFCGAGGAAMGYSKAGFEVIGVDINPQPNFPFEFIQADAVEYLALNWKRFNVIHASPPCQRFTKCQKIKKNEHPDYVWPIRNLMPDSVQWVIENVPGSPLINPIMLCGSSFGLGTYRHRMFESNASIVAHEHREHQIPTAKMGRPVKNGEMMHVVGNFSGVAQARIAMGIDWMTRNELRESIPPAYTEFIGKQLIQKGGAN